MKKACLLDQTLQLPPIGTRVAIHDDEEPGTPHPGTVCGHGTATRAGANVASSTPLVPTVLVQLDRGVYLVGNGARVTIPEAERQRCYVQVIAVHPDNLLTDQYGRWVTTLEV